MQKTRAVLRVAPDWVLKALDAAPDEFFYGTDAELIPNEVGAIVSGALASWAPEIRSSVFPRALDALSTSFVEEDGRRIGELLATPTSGDRAAGLRAPAT